MRFVRKRALRTASLPIIRIPSSKLLRLGTLSASAFILIISVISLFAFSTRAAAQVDRGDIVFHQKCNSCHTIGGGRSVGPDLKGVTTRREHSWLISFITGPDKMVLQGDPIAQQIVKEFGLLMPNLGISEADATAILEYIATQAPDVAPAPPPTKPTAPAEPAAPPRVLDAKDGKDLFTGRVQYKNGGPACIICHNVSTLELSGGGTMGKDLSAAYATMGKTALESILKTTPFPIMKEIYTPTPLTDQEIAGVLAFLKEASESPANTTQSPALFFIIGIGGAAFIIVLFQLLWRGRLTGVRRALVKGGSK